MRVALAIAVGLSVLTVGCGSEGDGVETGQSGSTEMVDGSTAEESDTDTGAGADSGAGADMGDLPGEPITGEMQTTPSGLQYALISQGEGTQAQAGNLVTVDYTGYFEDGSVFDSSSNAGQPFQFTLGRGEVISGWDEGVGMMNVGSKYKFVIPGSLAYGEAGFPGVIPPNATLIFDVELHEAE